MSKHEEQVDLNRMLSRAGPYPLEAFNFVREGLSFTVQLVHSEQEPGEDADRHITGQQLCLGLREFAIDRYGLLAPAVLDHWNIRRTDDFGRIVFAMIDEGLMSRTDEDSLEDFRSVFNFGEAFSRDELLSRIGTA